jgi:hypothetical protein
MRGWGWVYGVTCSVPSLNAAGRCGVGRMISATGRSIVIGMKHKLGLANGGHIQKL